jgi:hypothetical protein
MGTDMNNPETVKHFFGEGARFEHVGIAVRSISSELKDAEITEDPVHKVNVAFIYIEDIKVELVEPNTEKSPVTNILQKGQSLYHMCFLVPNLEKAVKAARENGFHCISRITPGKAYDNAKVTWVFSKIYGMFELIEHA